MASDAARAVARQDAPPPRQTALRRGARWGERGRACARFRVAVLALGAALLAACGSSAPAPAWTPTGPMTSPRTYASATVLGPSGRVLVAGGVAVCIVAGVCLDSSTGWSTASAELYDPATGRWARTAPMHRARAGHEAVLLSPDNPNVPEAARGKVLVASGAVRGEPEFVTRLTSAELYDPEADRWIETGAMGVARNQFSLALLETGKVLAAGGWEIGAGVGYIYGTATAELYDAGAGAWQRTGSMATARASAGGALLASGRFLVVGGIDSSYNDSPAAPLQDAEQYDPATGQWSPAGKLVSARCCGHAVVRLLDGRVLAAGGFTTAPVGLPAQVSTQAEIYDPATGKWTATGSMGSARTWFRAALLPSGKVLVLGGSADASAELYDPATGAWSPAGRMTTPRLERPVAALLPSGRVLAAGGTDDRTFLASAELFSPE